MRILLTDHPNAPLFRELCNSLEAEYISFPDRRDDGLPKEIDIGITYDEFNAPAALMITKLRDCCIPTLHIADGILEWRNTWNQERINQPSGGGMPLYQPILCDKFACLGRSHARILESWGNLGKCEIVGSPRFDPMLKIRPRPVSDAGPVRVLIVTARTPYFSDRERDKTVASLMDLKDWFDKNAKMGERDLLPVWRLTKGLDREIGLPTGDKPGPKSDLVTALNEADAVITTPSTVLLEAMLMRRPVALLDYTNSPQYVPAAWRIMAPHHIGETIRDLVAPPPARLLYQDTILHDALECRTPATPRLITLIEEMVRISRDCKAQGRALSFPDRILPDPEKGHHLPEELFDMRSLYPDHPVFGNMDRVELQTEIGHLRNKIAADESTLQKTLDTAQELERIRRYGSGHLVSRLVHTFPFPRKMWRAASHWRKDRHNSR